MLERSPQRDPGADEDHVVELLMRIAEQLHRYGTPSHRVEGILTSLGEQFGLDVSIFCVPTMIEVAVGRGAGQRSMMLRVEPGATNLARLESMLAIIEDLRTKRVTVGDAIARINHLDRHRRLPRLLPTIVALGATGGAAALIFGGAAHEIISAGVVCAIAGFAVNQLSRTPSKMALADFLAGAIVAFLANCAAGYFPTTSTSIVTIASLIAFLPGLSLATAMNELAMRHLVSGTSRLMGAIMSFVAIGFGVAVGDRIADSFVPLRFDVAPLRPPGWTLVPAVLLAATSLSVLYRAHRRDLGWVLLGTAIGFGGAAVGESLLGPALGVCVGATLVGLAGNLVARLRPKPSALLIIPGITLLLPGSAGFRGLHALMQKEVISGIDTATTAIIVTGSLVAGLLVANALLPAPRGL